MAEQTHQERVRDEIVRQWPERVRARATLIQRPLGMDDVSEHEARVLWWQRDPKGEQALLEQPGMSQWQATTLLYPYRAALLDAARARGGVQEIIRFSDRMSAHPPRETTNG